MLRLNLNGRIFRRWGGCARGTGQIADWKPAQFETSGNQLEVIRYEAGPVLGQ